MLNVPDRDHLASKGFFGSTALIKFLVSKSITVATCESYRFVALDNEVVSRERWAQ